MGHVLVTGMSGAGKSTVLEELARGGYSTVDTDDDRWTMADGSWDEVRMTRLLASEAQVVVFGTVANQVLFYDRFAHVALLSAPGAGLGRHERRPGLRNRHQRGGARRRRPVRRHPLRLGR